MKIACVLGQGFEDSEYSEPAAAYTEAGHQVTVIGTEAGQDLEGKRGAVTVRSQLGIGDARAEDYDALFIPGGQSPDRIRADDRMVAFARAIAEADKPVFAICHGPQLLITARVVRGRRMTAAKSIRDDLDQVGASVFDEEVVVDRGFVTSRSPQDIPAFNRESLRLLEGVAAL